MAVNLGITWQQAAEFDLPSVSALEEQWRRCPPTRYLVAAYMEYQPPTAANDVEAQKQVQAELAETLPVRTDVVPTDTSAFDAAFAAAEVSEPERT